MSLNTLEVVGIVAALVGLACLAAAGFLVSLVVGLVVIGAPLTTAGVVATVAAGRASARGGDS